MGAGLSHIESVFHQALAIKDRTAQASFLATACAGNPSLLAEVGSLLAAFQDSGPFLAGQQTAGEVDADHPTQADSPPTDVSPVDLARRMLDRLRSGEPIGVKAALQNVDGRARAECVGRLGTAILATVRALPRGPVGVADPGKEPLPELRGYVIRRRLGGGGLGVVYEGFEESLQRSVAVKVLRPTANAAERDQVLREARNAASLQDPGVVTIHRVVEEGPTPAIIMELVEGFPIDRATAELPFMQRARVLMEVARALTRAHARGLIHRDLKPENVLVTPEMKPKLLDFGLAVSAEEAVGLSGGFAGTPLYASPEQAAGLPLTPASDVFSFGSLMYKVLTGRPAFTGKDSLEVLERICTTAPPFLRDVAGTVPEDLQAICLACLSFAPTDRPSAEELVGDLNRFLAGEPVRLRPALYGDILRQKLSAHSAEVESWRRQGMVSVDEADRLQAVHRRILADEDHWIVDARRLTPIQTALYTSTWMVVVAALMLVSFLRSDLSSFARWSLPLTATLMLAGVGLLAERRREPLAAAAFLASAVLAAAPAMASLLAELGLWGHPPPDVGQLMPEKFTNLQLLVATLFALGLSVFTLRRLQMTGFAWTTAVFGAAAYVCGLSVLGWLDQRLQVQALWCLPLVLGEGVALGFERVGRVRWALPFHWGAVAVLVGALDVMAMEGPTLKMLGIDLQTGSYFQTHRVGYLSFALNGFLFMGLMLLAERSRSLDLRRIGRVLEIMALPHLLLPLFQNARESVGEQYLKLDVGIYLSTVLLLLTLGPWQSRWRMLLGGLSGVALGSYLLIDLELVEKKSFIIGFGLLGLGAAIVAYGILVRRQRAGSTTGDAVSATRQPQPPSAS